MDLLDVVLMQEADSRGKHLTMDGSFVDCRSQECLADLERRIDDMAHARDLATTRSDERTYYNGVLSVLRRRLRNVRREIASQADDKKKLRESTKKTKRDSSRMLKLAGIF